jgi:hypothetical protein
MKLCRVLTEVDVRVGKTMIVRVLTRERNVKSLKKSASDLSWICWKRMHARVPVLSHSSFGFDALLVEY